MRLTKEQTPQDALRTPKDLTAVDSSMICNYDRDLHGRQSSESADASTSNSVTPKLPSAIHEQPFTCCWLDYVVERVSDKVRPQDQNGHLQPTAVTIERDLRLFYCGYPVLSPAPTNDSVCWFVLRQLSLSASAVI